MSSDDRSRSVNDFDTTEGLKAALKSQEYRAAFSEVGRDFPLFGAMNQQEQLDDDNVSIASTTTSIEEQQELDWILTNYNAELSQTQSLSEELKRLQCLKSYLLLDSERESSFERLTALASRMFRVPIALVSLVDLGRQWFMSNRGLGDVRETPRRLAFCAHAILSTQDLFVIEDATMDARFSENPLVVGPPHIRFYAGAPLLCPEGYKLGTFCLIDTKPRQSGLSLEEKQNLRELAALAVDAMVERKREKLRSLEHKSQIIACTAHDLLTPLNGVQMSLSLLLEDDELQQRLSPNQKELIVTAESCADVMNRICQHAMESFRNWKPDASVLDESSSSNKSGHIVVQELVKNLHVVMEPYPKSVPLYITVEDDVPPVVLSDDLKIFRAAVNFLTNACKHTQRGSVHLRISTRKKKLLFECQDTGPGVPLEYYPFLFRPFREDAATDDTQTCCGMNSTSTAEDLASMCSTRMNHSGLGLYSVASQITSIGGEYGFRPQSEGAVFWFSVPLKVPRSEIELVGRRSSFKDLPEVAQAQRVQLTRQADKLAQKIQDLSASLSSTQYNPNQASSIHSNMKTEADGKLFPSNEFESMDTDIANAPAVDVDDTVVPSSSPTRKRTRRALVIDDSLVIRKALSRAMSKLGFEVKLSINGLDGLKDLQTDVFDVVFCDFLMPVMDGLDCVQQYRDWEAIHRPWIHQYIVGISAHASQKDIDKGLSVGMDDFKAKPVTLQVLKELEGSPELKQVSEVLDSVLGPGKHGDVEQNETAIDGEKLYANKRAKTNDGPVCLVGEDAMNISKSMGTIMKDKCWNPVFVNDGEDALRLLKMRNWDAVFLDEDMPLLDGIRVIERFRQWEKNHRVARQKNVVLVSQSFVPNPKNGKVSAAYPAGFDGALGKPILPSDLIKLLDVALIRITTSSDSCDIVTR